MTPTLIAQVQMLGSQEIKELRLRENSSQPVFARYLLQNSKVIFLCKNGVQDKRCTAATCMAEEVLAEYAINTIMENAMPTRNVVLTDSQAQFVEQMVQAGRYQNASEVLREGLRLVQTREAEQAAKLAALREAVAVGVADIEAGRYTEFADAASLRSHITAISKRVLAKHG